MPTHATPLEFFQHPLPDVSVKDLRGRLIVIEGPDSVGRSTQVQRLRAWLEERGYAVVDTGMARSPLTKKGIREAMNGHTLGPLTMALFYMADFADRLENIIIPSLRAGFVVLTDRYFYSVVARAAARHQDADWLEEVAGFALVPHATFYLRAPVKEVLARVVRGQRYFDYWESGMDVPYGRGIYESFIGYQRELITILDSMADSYGFTVVDADRPPNEIFSELRQEIERLLTD